MVQSWFVIAFEVQCTALNRFECGSGRSCYPNVDWKERI